MAPRYDAVAALDTDDAGAAALTPASPARGPATAAAARLWSSGVACVLVAAGLYSAATALVRPAARVPVLQIVAVRSAVSLALSLASRGAQRGAPLFGARAHFPLLAARGVLGAMAMDAFYMGVTRLPLGDAVALLFLNPALTAVLSICVLGEALGRVAAAGVAASLAGMLLVVRPPLLFGGSGAWTRARAVGTVAGGASAVLAAAALVMIRVIGERETALTVAVWFHSSALASSLLLAAAGGGALGAPVWPTLAEWAALLGIAAASFGANILLSRGYQLERAALASAVNVTQVAYAYLLGVLLFGERPAAAAAAGVALLAAGVCAVAAGTRAAEGAERAAAAAAVGAAGGVELGEAGKGGGAEPLAPPPPDPGRSRAPAPPLPRHAREPLGAPR
jgi:drug/metabolite transporter (DMT)-like permease